MAWSLVSQTSAGTTSSNAAAITSSAINTAGANHIIVAVGSYFNDGSCTVTDSNGNTYQALTAYSYYNTIQLFYCQGGTVGAGHTFTATMSSGTSAAGPSIAVLAFSGAASSPLDQQNGADGNTGGQPGSITPGVNDELVITALSFDNGPGLTTSINDSFTISGAVVATSNTQGVNLAYLVQSTAAAINLTWSWSGGSPSHTAVAIASFKPGAGGTVYNQSASITLTESVRAIKMDGHSVALTLAEVLGLKRAARRAVALLLSEALGGVKRPAQTAAIALAEIVAATKAPRRTVALSLAETVGAVKRSSRKIALTQAELAAALKRASRAVGVVSAESLGWLRVFARATLVSITEALGAGAQTFRGVIVRLLSGEGLGALTVKARGIVAAAATGSDIVALATTARWWRMVWPWQAAMPTFAWRPSRQRVIPALDFAGPAQRGARATPLPRRWPSHGAGWRLDYSIDFGTSIASPTSLAVTAVPASLVVSAVVVEGERLTVWLAGGVSRTDYVVSVDLTAGGRVWKLAIAIHCL